MLGVETHDRGQQNSVGNAVGNVVLAAQWIAQGVYRRGAAGRDCQTAIISCNLHTVFLSHSLRVIAGFFDIVENQVQPFQRIQVAERICLIAGKALNAVGQCVHAGGCCDLARQILNHAGVKNHIISNHVLVDNADLQFFFRHSHNGIGGNLGTGTGCGGNQNNRYALFCTGRLVQQFLDAVLIGHKDTSQLGRIHDGAAAAGNNHISTAGLELVYQLLHSHVARFCRQVIQYIIIGTAGLDGCFGQGKQARPLNAFVGEYRNALDTVAFQNRGDVIHRVFAAVHGMGHFQTVSGKHNKNLPINANYRKKHSA